MPRRSYLKVLTAILSPLLFSILTTPARQVQEYNAPPAATLTSKLVKELVGSGIKTIVVFDLTGPDGQFLPFGAWLADRISDGIAGKQIRIVDRARLDSEMHLRHLQQQDVSNAELRSSISQSLGADGFIGGSFGPFKDQIGVTLAMWRTTETNAAMTFRFVSMVNGKMPLDSEARSHLTVPLESLTPNDGIYRAGYAGRTVAKCESCPPPQFPAAALWKIKKGTVVTMIVISAEGRVSDVKIVESPDRELNTEAIRAIQSYKYKPALDPDGEPVAVRMPFTVDFRIR